MAIPFWRQAAEVFDRRATEYDRWFEESLLFAIELAALRDLALPLPAPRCEVGVGPGRFAQALGASIGFDAALAPLALARERGIAPVQAIGEALPVRAGALGTIFLLFTLCFIEEPPRILRECARALQADGLLVAGSIPAAGAWGRLLRTKQEQGHPFYRHARFYEPATIEGWLQAAGLTMVASRSTLFQPPERLQGVEASRPGLDPGAGFVVLAAAKRS
ncbi:MAG: methyltransferase domain-containing protein [Desulfobacteraceae bacterium]|nr:methyltransferase domain-containing protein [Desulfobacteraceae bacterium]